jgi:hypothetical protein
LSGSRSRRRWPPIGFRRQLGSLKANSQRAKPSSRYSACRAARCCLGCSRELNSCGTISPGTHAVVALDAAANGFLHGRLQGQN